MASSGQNFQQKLHFVHRSRWITGVNVRHAAVWITSLGREAIGPSGNDLWFRQVQNPATDTDPFEAVRASLAVGDLEGGTDVVAPSLGQETYAFDGPTGNVRATGQDAQAAYGFPARRIEQTDEPEQNEDRRSCWSQ